MRRYWFLGLFLLLAISVQAQGWSDARLKNVLGEVEPVLEKIKALKPIRYTWNKPGQQKVKTTDKSIRYGFLAQEMKKVFPEFISEGEDGYLLYNSSGYEAILTRAIQELLKEIDTLRAEINKLKATTANVGIYMTSPSYRLDVSRP
jgi:hypothetical protein